MATAKFLTFFALQKKASYDNNLNSDKCFLTLSSIAVFELPVSFFCYLFFTIQILPKAYASEFHRIKS